MQHNGVVTSAVGIGALIGGRWRITSFIGQGAFGQVFRATDESVVGLGEAAVKLLHPNTSPAERAEFLNEVQKIAKLRHQNLVAYLDSGDFETADGVFRSYLVTELCTHSLDDVTPLALDQADALVAHLGAGLTYLHRRQLLHRDLKPANVLFADGQWKLADFGLARDLSATGHYHHGEVIKGTPRFMAPELFESAKASGSADVYSLGVLVHRAITGKYVHGGENDIGFLVNLSSVEPQIDPTLPGDWRYFIEQCVQRDPLLRPRADQFADVLTHARSNPSIAHATPTLAARVAPGEVTDQVTLGSSPATSADRRPLIAAAVAVLLLVGIVGAVFLARPESGVTTNADDGSTTEIDDGAGDDGPTTDGDDGGGQADSGPPPPPPPPDISGLAPNVRAGFVILESSDAPPDHVSSESPPAPDEVCSGVENPRARFPGIAEQRIQFSGVHFFIAQVTVHESAAAAAEQVEYAATVSERCVGVRDLDTDAVITFAEPFAVDLPGADTQSAVVLTTREGTFAFGLHTIYAQVGDTTVFSSGTDEGVVVYYARLMLAKAAGLPRPETVEPAGLRDLGSGAENPAAIRQTIVSQGAGPIDASLLEWLDTHDDTDVAILARSMCEALSEADDAEVGRILVDLFNATPSELRGDLTQDGFAQFFGIATVVFCPDQADRILAGPG